MGRFQVLFSGQVAERANETTVRQNLMRRLGLDERKVSQLFSGRTVVIRSDLTREAADELQAELAELGAIARIKDLTPDDKAKFKIDKHIDQTLKDITAAHIECPRCGHLQLESEFCARCGVDISAASKQKRKEDLLIEKRIREFKVQKSSTPTTVVEHVAPPVEAVERLQPIKRRAPRPPQVDQKRHAAPQRLTTAVRSEAPRRETPRAETPRRDPPRRDPPQRESPRRDPPRAEAPREEGTTNPFGGGFWRNVLKLGRKDERSP
jgi:ribosomal protein L37E